MTNSVTLEDKRRSLCVALLRYTQEAGSLRERALDRMVQFGLLGTSKSDSIRISAIQSNMQFGLGRAVLRVPVIQNVLSRLTERGIVAQVEHRKTHSYHLTPDGAADLAAAEASASELFEPVLERMLENTGHLCAPDVAALVCRRFVSECFARFGQQIARAVTGQVNRDQLVGSIDSQGAFKAATKMTELSPEATDSLHARCDRFLRSTEPCDEQLRFRLTQGYFVAQLLGLDEAPFNPLAEEAFRDSVFYMDTNVLIPRVISSEAAPLFDEVVRVASRLGIELRVTRATINETRLVATAKREALDAVIGKVPYELLEKSKDATLSAYAFSMRVRF